MHPTYLRAEHEKSRCRFSEQSPGELQMTNQKIAGFDDKHHSECETRRLSFIHETPLWDVPRDRSDGADFNDGVVVSVYPGERFRADAIRDIEKTPIVYWRFGPWPYRPIGGSPEHYDPAVVRHALKSAQEIFVNLYAALSDAGRTDEICHGGGFWWPDGDGSTLCLAPRVTLIEAPLSASGRWEAVLENWATVG